MRFLSILIIILLVSLITSCSIDTNEKVVEVAKNESKQVKLLERAGNIVYDNEKLKVLTQKLKNNDIAILTSLKE